MGKNVTVVCDSCRQVYAMDEVDGPVACEGCGAMICEDCEDMRCEEGRHDCPLCGVSMGGCRPAHVTIDDERAEPTAATTTYDRDRLVLEAAEKVAEAAREPDCNFNSERECGFSPDGKSYRHHPRFCPRGRLITALAEYDRVRAVDRATAATESVSSDDPTFAVLDALARSLARRT